MAPRPTSIVPSVRVQKEDTDASANGFQTGLLAAPASFDASSDRGDLDVRERLDVTYNGITNWVLYARGELAEGQGRFLVDHVPRPQHLLAAGRDMGARRASAQSLFSCRQYGILERLCLPIVR